MDPYVEALERAVTCYAGRPVLERIKADPAHALELRAYPKSRIARNVINAQAKWSSAR
jgi:hypothetical protein